MSTPSILTFDIHPPFRIDLSQYSRLEQQSEAESLALSQKIKTIGLSAIKHVGFLFDALSKAFYSTLSNAGISFKHIVLGYYGSIWNFRPPADIYLVVFKIVFWVLAMGWCTLVTTIRLIYEHDPARDHNLLNQFLSPEIDPRHIRTKELSIDIRGMPANITINNLLPLFDQINFNDPQSLNYMAPGSCREGYSTYTTEEMKNSLKKFVDNVNGRVAFLGTPPTYDTPRLMAFYQQIENAVRFSLHKASVKFLAEKENYERFMINHNQQIPAEEDPDHEEYISLRRLYRNAFEDQARITINLAFAGKHCGARYMGESMALYDYFSTETSVGQATLEDTLVAILAAKRKEIAREEIETRLGTDTHKYNQYISSLGRILGIPGTENVIEHLSASLNRNEYLKYFFEKYTVDCIINTVNAKVKSSQVFREEIINWLRDHPGDWNTQNSEQALKLLEESHSFLSNNQIMTNSPIFQSFLKLQRLITFMKEKGTLFPKIGDDWDEFLTELFAQDAAREYLTGTPIEIARAKQGIKSLFSDEKLGQMLIQKVKEAITKESSALQVEDFSQRFLALQKIDLLSRHINPAVAMRVVQGHKDLREAILEQREQERGFSFIEQLIDPEALVVDGLSPKLMEWILVSQKILHVQSR